MTEATIHAAVAWGIIGLAVVTAVALGFVTAPYGRHQRSGWGPTVPSRVAWALMEMPSSVGFLLVFLGGDRRAELVPLLLLCVWLTHYVHRTFIYPFLIRDSGKRMPVLVVALGFTFNCANAWVNARWISHLGVYDATWLGDPRLIFGIVLFAAGMALNLLSDATLRGLRRPGETGYGVPHGGGYRFVSCPNYLGEIIEWSGWALATWSLAGSAFALYTIANLAPRAIAHHRWYRDRFGDYPPARRALLPFIL